MDQLGTFTRYVPARPALPSDRVGMSSDDRAALLASFTRADLAAIGTLFARDDDGNDWYEVIEGLDPNDGLFGLVQDGVIVSVASDPKQFMVPDNHILVSGLAVGATIGDAVDGF